MTTPTTATSTPIVRQRSLAGIVGHQFRYDLPMYWRNTQSVFSTLALPVIFLLILSTVFGNSSVKVPGGSIKLSVYYVPSVIALGIISASFGNLAASVVSAREAGIYKRRRATPVRAIALIAARALVAVLVALVITAVLLVIGYAYGASIPGRTAPAFILDVVVGSLAFCCLGYALASVVHDSDSVTPVVTSITLPLYFISGVFIASAVLPHWLLNLADIFPVRHLAIALLAAYNPHTTGSGLRWGDLAVIAAWGIFGLVIALWRFSWLPEH
jgi:ABC-2 type transport system permease protein